MKKILLSIKSHLRVKKRGRFFLLFFYQAILKGLRGLSMALNNFCFFQRQGGDKEAVI